MEHRHAFVEPVDMATSRLRALLRRLVAPPLAAAGRLVRCSECGADTANPVRWHEHDDTHWWIRLRCGECQAVREVIATDDEAERLACDLLPGLTRIAVTATKLERDRMRADLTTLTTALERDLIAADDFVR